MTTNLTAIIKNMKEVQASLSDRINEDGLPEHWAGQLTEIQDHIGLACAEMEGVARRHPNVGFAAYLKRKANLIREIL